MEIKNNNKNSKKTNNVTKNEIINLKPTYVIPEENNFNIINFNSIFLYLFIILEIFITILILYFFFKKEIIFVFKNLFYNNDYTNEEKTKYNKNMYDIKKLFETVKYCKLLNKIVINNNTTITDKFFPLYGNNKFMLALNNDHIFFNTEKECKEFLNLN